MLLLNLIRRTQRLASSDRLEHGGDMRRDDIMKADLLSELVLLGSGLVILMSLLMVILMAMSNNSLA